MKKYPPSPKKATAQTVASNNLIAYGIFRFHEGMSICRFHELSHSHASFLIEKGFSPLLIADRLGHENIETTLQTYSHLYPNKHSEVATLIEVAHSASSKTQQG